MNEQLKSKPDVEKAISRIEKLMKESNRPILVALDGRSGSGKSTLAKLIAKRLDGVEITADNFWIGGSNEEWDKRSPEEKADMAIDWKRLRTQSLEPLLTGKSAAWHPFDWNTGKGQSSETIQCGPTKLILLDGAYSSRPELHDIIDLSILVEVPDDSNRRTRLVKRENEAYMKDWHARWDAAEEYYFQKVRPRHTFDIILLNE